MNFHQYPQLFVKNVHLYVENLERSLAFYRNIVGLYELRHDDQKVELTADGKNLLLTIEQPEGARPKSGRTTGLYHFALLLPERSELAIFLQHLIKSGWPIQGASDHLVSEAIYFQDPDGNGIEVYADRLSKSWEWENSFVRMTTEPLDVRGLLAQANGKVWNGLPKETIMGHIHLHVADIQKAEDFYINGLGYSVVQSLGDHALFISTGRYHHHIGLNIWNGKGAPAPAENSAGLHSFTLTFPTDEKRNELLQHLDKLGIQAETSEERVFVRDPSLNRIELLVAK